MWLADRSMLVVPEKKAARLHALSQLQGARIGSYGLMSVVLARF